MNSAVYVLKEEGVGLSGLCSEYLKRILCVLEGPQLMYAFNFRFTLNTISGVHLTNIIQGNMEQRLAPEART